MDIFTELTKEENYFAQRQSLKMEYMVMVKYEKLRRAFTNDQEKLKYCMQLVLSPNKAI